MAQTANRSPARRNGRSRKPAKTAAREPGLRRGERRDDIIAAALEEFSASGFAAARLDDVARRAGVAKGTIYLYFRDKETLFQELVRAMVHPLVGALTTAPLQDIPIRAVLEMILVVFI